MSILETAQTLATITTAIVTPVAIWLGPIYGIRKQKKIEHDREHKYRQLHIFRVLMTTRTTPVAVDHVTALNLIDIEFSAKKEKEKPVIDAWKFLLDHLNNGYPNYDTDKDKPEYTQKRNDATTKSREYLEVLLDEMSKCLGYDFERIIIKRDSYYSASQVDKDNDDFLIRKGLRDVLHGYRPVSVDVKNSPAQIPNENDGDSTK